MCRNIKILFNFDPPATNKEIHEASLQFVRKISGFREPSTVNEVAFNHAVEEISEHAQELLMSLVTQAPKHNREIEAQKAHERAVKRFGSTPS